MFQIGKQILKNSRNIITIRTCCSHLVETCEQNGIREIMLNDAKTRNSLSMAMMTEIHKEIIRDQDNPKLRVIILSAKPGPIFSSGHNLKEFALGQETSQPHRAVFHALTEIIQAIRNSPVPVIGKVNGLAAAAGCQLVASCDILICSDKSKFSLPGANFGIFCSTPSVAVTRTMPRMKSAFMAMTGIHISAKEADIAGLVSRVVPEDKLDEEVENICKSITRKSRSVIALGKEFFYKQLSMNINDAYCAGEDVMVKNLKIADGKEGIQSFIEKRQPKWKS